MNAFMKAEKLLRIFVWDGDIDPELSITQRISILLLTELVDCLKVCPVGSKLKLAWLFAQLTNKTDISRNCIILIFDRVQFIRSPKEKELKRTAGSFSYPYLNGQKSGGQKSRSLCRIHSHELSCTLSGFQFLEVLHNNNSKRC